MSHPEELRLQAARDRTANWKRWFLTYRHDLARHIPELANEIRGLFPALLVMEEVRPVGCSV